MPDGILQPKEKDSLSVRYENYAKYQTFGAGPARAQEAFMAHLRPLGWSRGDLCARC